MSYIGLFTHAFPYSGLSDLNLDWVITECGDIRKAIDDLTEEFKKIEILTPDEINAMIDVKISEFETKVNALIERTANDTYMRSKGYTDEQIAIIRDYIAVEITTAINTCKDYSLDLYNQMKTYVDNKFIDYTYMLSPFTGEMQDVREIVNDIINKTLKVNSLTAGKYDAIGITAGEYDALRITAYDYDFDAKNRVVKP